MDLKVKSLLDNVSHSTNNKECQNYLQEALEILLEMDRSQFTRDLPKAMPTDILIRCTELAIKNGIHKIAEECIKLYFLKAATTDPYKCVAYLCLAQLSAPTNVSEVVKLEEASQHILRAIVLALKNTSLSEEIYNASVLYWQFCRPFLRPGFYLHVTGTLDKLLKALAEVNNKNYVWRAMLYITLIECYIEADHKTNAIETTAIASLFIKQFVPSQYKRLFSLMVRHQLIDSAAIQTEIKSSPEISVYYSILKLTCSIENKNTNKDFSKEIKKILAILGVEFPNMSLSTSSHESTPTLTPVIQDTDKRSSTKLSRTPVDKSIKRLPLDSPDRPHLLLEMIRLCLKIDFVKLAQACINVAKVCKVDKQSFYTQLEFADCEIMVKLLGDKQESYRKKPVETRLAAIKLCEDNITNAVRQHDAPSIQCGCVTLWNLCVPLLQSNLRRHLRKPLTLIAQALEDIQSLLVQLRCQIHRELALCEEKEHIRIAIRHLKKAIALDDMGVYHDELLMKLNRLNLQSELYAQQENPEEVAGMIIEQARAAESKGTIEMKRALLMKAGIALAPDAFQFVLDSEKMFHETRSKLHANNTDQLAKRANTYNMNIHKTDGHLRRIGNTNDQKRMHLWADLVKVARKQGVWDVCRTATRFCLLYDDNRWQAVYRDSGSAKVGQSRVGSPVKSEENNSDISTSPKKQRKSATEKTKKTALCERQRVRLLAEINFIQGEALIQLLQQEEVNLNDQPVYPVDYSKHGRNYIPTKPAEDRDWNIYCQWISQLNSSITKSFLQGLTLGVNLNETWLVGNAAVYLWNYNNHIIGQNRHSEITDCLATILEGFKKVGHDGFISLLVNICTALTTGIIMPWMPVTAEENIEMQSPSSPTREKTNVRKNQQKTPQILVSPDALPDLKKAIEICEYAIELTNGKKQQDTIPLAERMSLLQTWVIAKQMSQQQIGKSFGKEDDSYGEYERQTLQIIVNLEMYTHTKNGIMEFKDVLSLPDLVGVMERCQWTDTLVKLQLYTRLAYLLYNNKNYDLVIKVTKSSTSSYLSEISRSSEKNRNQNTFTNTCMEEQVSHLFLLMGQSLIENMDGQSIRQEAINNFVNAAKFALSSHNYQLVISAAQNYWNAILSVVNICSERKYLQTSLQAILTSISEVTSKIQEVNSMRKLNTYSPSITRTTLYGPVGNISKTEPVAINDDDLTLRVSLYDVLYETYADNKDWEKAIKVLNTAISELPQTHHRMQLFKERILTKAKLGENMLMDFQKFRDEKEDFVASLWRDIALHSKELSEQCFAYQKAIESLSSDEYNWQKVDYLLEFGQWLYTHQMPEQDVIDQMEWAVDILMGMQFEPLHLEDSELKKNKTRSEASADSKKKDEQPPPPPPKTSNGSNEDGSSINTIDYIPLEKEITIGAPLTTSVLDMKKINSVKQLDYLIKCHVLLTEIYTPASPLYQQYCLMAYSFTIRLWQICVLAAIPVVQEITKTYPMSPKETPLPNRGQEKGKDKGKGKKEKGQENSGSPTKDKNKNKNLNTNILPQTPEEWAVFELPTELLEALNHESLKNTGINENSITKPMLSLYYLEQLVSNLRGLGFNHLALPVLALNHVIVTQVLHSKSLIFYTHCKRMEVCAELNLQNCCEFHEKIITQTVSIELNELIKMREDFDRHIQEKKINIEEKQNISNSENNHENSNAHKSHLGQNLKDIFHYQIWTKVAETLIKQARYQQAREYLYEAYQFAVHFKDPYYQGRLCFLKAKLAFVEAQYKEAFDSCMEAQEIQRGDKHYWYKTVLLMSESAIHAFHKKGHQLAQQIITNAIKEFEKLTLNKQNQAVGFRLIIAQLQAKLGEIQTETFLYEYTDLSPAYIQESIQLSLTNFEDSTEFLLTHKFTKDAIKVMHSHAKMLHRIAKAAANNIEMLQSYYMQSVKVLKNATFHAQKVLYNVMMTIPRDVQLSFPIQREVANLQNDCAEIMVEIQEIQVKEEMKKREEDEHKKQTMKIVEKFIMETPDYSDYEKEWAESKYWISDEILSRASFAHCITKDMPKIRSRSLLIVGRCLLHLSSLKHTDPPKLWLLTEMGLNKPSSLDSENIRTDEEEENGQQINGMSAEVFNLSKKMKKIKRSAENSISYLSQASECLTQALNMALLYKLADIAMQASWALVNCTGQFDIIACSQFLALYQSCQASLYLTKLLECSQPDPYTCRLSALLHQRRHLLKNNVIQNFSSSDLFNSITCTLETEWQAWKRTLISVNHLVLTKEFPQNFNFILLQHSPDKHFLYCSLLDKCRPVKSAANPKQQTVLPNTPASPSNRTCVFGCPVNPERLYKLQEMVKLYKKEAQHSFLRQSVQKKNQNQCKNMLECLSNSPNISDSASEVEDENQNWMQDRFQEIVVSMEEYFSPVLKPLATTLKSFLLASSGNSSSHANPEYIIILADSDLLELPLESLSIFQEMEDIASLTRDISLQLFFHRFHNQQDSAATDELKYGKKKDKKQQQAPSRIHGVKDVGKKGKSVSLDRTMPPWGRPIDTASIKYIVDTNYECNELSEEHNPSKLFKSVLVEYEQYFTSHWVGLCGDERVASSGEWEVYLNESGSFIFFGPDKLTTYLSPSKLSAFNISKCMLVYQLDLSENYMSYDRQSHLNVLKKDQTLSLENPVSTALLLSLAGVRCIMGNQWSCALGDNVQFLTTSMNDLLQRGFSTGETLRHVQTPYLMKEERAKTEEEDSKKEKVSNKKGSERKKSGKKIIFEDESSNTLKSREDTVVVEPVEIQHKWFNMVCYGLPNLIVTQI